MWFDLDMISFCGLNCLLNLTLLLCRSAEVSLATSLVSMEQVF